MAKKTTTKVLSPKTEDEKKVLATIRFYADTVLPLLKACCSTDPLKYVLMQPAIDIRRGILVASDGIILAAHRLSGYHADIIDEEEIVKAQHIGSHFNLCVCIPMEALKMRGKVTVTVTQAHWSDEKSSSYGLHIVATDTKGNTAEALQDYRFPRWDSVWPDKIGVRQELGEAAMAAFTKIWQGTKKKEANDYYKCTILDIPRGGDTMKLSRNTYDKEAGEVTRTEVAPLPRKGVGIKVAMSSHKLRALATFAPKWMDYLSPTRAVAFGNDDTATRILVMPLLVFCEEGNGYCNIKYGTEEYKALPDSNIMQWINLTLKTPAAKTATIKPQAKAQPTLEERLRAALLRQIRQAA